jgi:hypothetical protein
MNTDAVTDLSPTGVFKAVDAKPEHIAEAHITAAMAEAERDWMREQAPVSIQNVSPVRFRIPEPPAGMFTDAELAAIKAGRARRDAAGTTAVGDE